jgi:hypothetical protein
MCSVGLRSRVELAEELFDSLAILLYLEPELVLLKPELLLAGRSVAFPCCPYLLLQELYFLVLELEQSGVFLLFENGPNQLVLLAGSGIE